MVQYWKYVTEGTQVKNLLEIVFIYLFIYLFITLALVYLFESLCLKFQFAFESVWACIWEFF